MGAPCSRGGEAMSRDLELRVAGEAAEAPEGWMVGWVDRAGGIARLSDGGRSLLAVVEGAGVAEGDALLTIEAMKMQNEVRAPRAGRVASMAVTPGQTVATGALLLRLE